MNAITEWARALTDRVTTLAVDRAVAAARAERDTARSERDGARLRAAQTSNQLMLRAHSESRARAELGRLQTLAETPDDGQGSSLQAAAVAGWAAAGRANAVRDVALDLLDEVLSRFREVDDHDVGPVVRTHWEPQATVEGWARYAADLRRNGVPVRACRVCGCTTADATECAEALSKPCWWVERDLCSRCMVAPPPPEGPWRVAPAGSCRVVEDHPDGPGVEVAVFATPMHAAIAVDAVDQLRGWDEWVGGEPAGAPPDRLVNDYDQAEQPDGGVRWNVPGTTS